MCDPVRDPELIAQKLGLTSYDPSKEYALLILDRQMGCPPADAEVIVPTYENLGKLAQEKIPKNFTDPALVDAVLTPAYSAEYATQMERAASQKLSVWKPWERKRFTSTMSSEDAEAFEARFTIQSSTGANEAFVGNGLTKQLDSSPHAYGALDADFGDREQLDRGS